MNLIISILELSDVMSSIFKLRGIPDNYAQFIIRDYIEAELEGHSSHGVAKLLLLDAALAKKVGSPTIVKKRGNFAKIDGNKDLGHIAGLVAIDTLLELAQKNMNSVVALTNASRYSRIKPFARMIAEAGYVGIIINNGGPAAVTPFGSKTPIFGTNPVCFSFPSKSNPYVFDFSTSKKVWAEIRQSMIEGRPLPSDCFLNASGKFTTDPNSAEAVLPFGEEKGYSLCYAVEILTGAFVSAKMGSKTADEYDLGFLFIAMSPEMFSTFDNFTESVDDLAQEVSQSAPLNNGHKVYIPGKRSQEVYNKNISNGTISINKEVWERLKVMSTSLDGGIESNSKIN